METKQAVKVERLHPLNGEGPTKAFCDILLMDSFLVKGLRVVDGKEGLFLGFPREQGKDPVDKGTICLLFHAVCPSSSPTAGM